MIKPDDNQSFIKSIDSESFYCNIVTLNIDYENIDDILNLSRDDVKDDLWTDEMLNEIKKRTTINFICLEDLTNLSINYCEYLAKELDIPIIANVCEYFDYYEIDASLDIFLNSKYMNEKYSSQLLDALKEEPRQLIKFLKTENYRAPLFKEMRKYLSKEDIMIINEIENKYSKKPQKLPSVKL